MRGLQKSLGAAALSAALAAAAGAGAQVRLDADAQSRLGVKTQTLPRTRHATEIDAFAKVLDPGPLAQLISDLQTAEAAAAASAAEARRSRALHAAGNDVSAKDEEAAVSQARQDALKVSFLRQRIGLEWGPGVARMSPARRAGLIAAIAAGKAALVHVDTHNNEGQDKARAVRIDVGSDSVRGAVLGPARSAEPRLQSSGLIVEVTGPSAVLLSIGLTQSAHIETKDPQTGFVAPRSAVIRYRGADWVYVRVGADGFQRKLLVSPQPQDGGLFVAGGLDPADQVVTAGAADLFADELSRSSGER